MAYRSGYFPIGIWDMWNRLNVYKKSSLLAHIEVITIYIIASIIWQVTECLRNQLCAFGNSIHYKHIFFNVFSDCSDIRIGQYLVKISLIY